MAAAASLVVSHRTCHCFGRRGWCLPSSDAMLSYRMDLDRATDSSFRHGRHDCCLRPRSAATQDRVPILVTGRNPGLPTRPITSPGARRSAALDPVRHHQTPQVSHARSLPPPVFPTLPTRGNGHCCPFLAYSGPTRITACQTLKCCLLRESYRTAESDRRARRSNSAQPSSRGSGARLINGLKCQGNDGVGRAAPEHSFHAGAAPPQRTWGLIGKSCRRRPDHKGSIPALASPVNAVTEYTSRCGCPNAATKNR
jgi:hypothetical protein